MRQAARELDDQDEDDREDNDRALREEEESDEGKTRKGRKGKGKGRGRAAKAKAQPKQKSKAKAKAKGRAKSSGSKENDVEAEEDQKEVEAEEEEMVDPQEKKEVEGKTSARAAKRTRINLAWSPRKRSKGAVPKEDAKPVARTIDFEEESKAVELSKNAPKKRVQPEAKPKLEPRKRRPASASGSSKREWSVNGREWSVNDYF